MAEDNKTLKAEIDRLRLDLKQLERRSERETDPVKIAAQLADIEEKERRIFELEQKREKISSKTVENLEAEKKFLTDILGLAENNKQVAEVEIELQEKKLAKRKEEIDNERKALIERTDFNDEEKKREVERLKNLDKEIEKEEKINELLRSRLEATKELGKNAYKDLNDLGLGLNNLSDSTFGSMLANLAFIDKSIGTIGDKLNSIRGSFRNIGNDFRENFSKGLESVFNTIAPLTDRILGRLASEMNKAFIQNMKDLTEIGPSFVEKTGQSLKVFNKNVTDAFGYIGSTEMTRFGVGLKEVSESFITLNETSSYFVQASKDTQKSYQDTALVSKKLGISYDSTAKSLDNMTRGFLVSGKQASANFTLIQREAIGAGISVGKMGKDFESVFPKLVAQGKQAVSIFIDLAKTANKLGLETSTLLSISEGYDTFEGAAEKAGALNAVLGGDYLNSLEMMNATESERIMIMKRSFDASGMQFNTLDKYSKKAVAASLGISDLNEAERLLSSSTSELSVELMKSAATEEERTKRAEEATKVSEKFAAAMQTLTSLASVLVNVFSTVVTALAEINDMMGGTLAIFTTILLAFPLLSKAFSGLTLFATGVRSITTSIGAAAAGEGGILGAVRRVMPGSRPAAPPTPPVPTPPAGPSPRAGGGISGFFRSMRGVFISYGRGSSEILKGAAVMGASMALLAIPLVAIGVALAKFGVDMKPLIELGAAMVLFAGSMFILSKISSGISFLAIASLAGGLALLAVGVFAIGTALQTFINLDLKTVMLGIATIGILTGAVFALGAAMTTGVGAAIFGSGLVAISLLGLAFVVLGNGLKSLGEGLGALGTFLSLDFTKIKEIDPAGLTALSGVVSAFKELEDVDANVVYNVSTVFQNVSNLKDIKKEQQEAVKGILEAATNFAVTVNNKSDDRLVNVLTKMTDAVLRIASAPVKAGATTASASPNSLYGRNTVQG